MHTSNTTREHVRVGKHLKEVVTISDAAGNVLHKVLRPLMVEVYAHDIIQMIVGASILAIPLGYTEEVWTLGATLPVANLLLISLVSIAFTALFVYYHFYRGHFRKKWGHFLMRVLSIYIISLTVAMIFLFLVQHAGGDVSMRVMLGRAIVIALPASLSAGVADMLK